MSRIRFAACLIALSVAGTSGVAARAASVTLPAGAWQAEAPAASPSARVLPAMASYGSGGQRVVLFGGYRHDGVAPYDHYLGDTWTWNGTTWTLRAVTGPPPRQAAAMATDPFGRVILFGGAGTDPATGSQVIYGDTWLWDGATWTEVPLAHPPAPRAAASIAYDALHGRVVLFGGLDGARLYDDTWTWDGAIWTKQAPSVVVPARAGAGMAYDPSSGMTVLYGGFREVSYSTTAPASGVAVQRLRYESFDDTWTWDGGRWTFRTSTYRPTGRAFGGLAYDAGVGRPVAFGGLAALEFDYVLAVTPVVPLPAGAYTYQILPSNDTWAWTSSSSWDVHPTTAMPPARWAAGLATDPVTGTPVLFGGVDGSGTSGLIALVTGTTVSDAPMFTGRTYDDTWTLRSTTTVTA